MNDILHPNRLATVTDNRRVAQGSASGVTTYSYDAAGNLSGYTYPNGVATSYTYDTLNRLTQMGSAKGGALSGYVYTLGAAGNRTSVAELSGRTVSYGYDALYRLTSEAITSDPASKNGTVGYSYDAVGNRQQMTSTLSAIPAGMFSYNANDQLSTDSYDSNGNTVSAAGITSGYDFENHMVQKGAVTVVYDGDGNRVAETVGGVTTKYLVDTLNPTGYAQVMDELVSGTVTRTYAYGLERISELQTISSTWTPSFYGYDGHGSVRQLTNAAGTVTDTYDYDAFGNLINSTGSTPNNYLFVGEQYDPALGLYYNRARYLNTNTGRFVTVDGIDNSNIADPLSLHLYRYSSADPINKIDPSGKTTISEVAVEATVLVTLAAITTIQALEHSPSHAKIEIPFWVRHYTQWVFVIPILSGGLNQERNYVTTDWYLSAKEAKSKLALSVRPQAFIMFFVFKDRDNLLGPNPVEPANGESGGGTEYYSDYQIPVSTRNPIVVPLFTD